MTTLRNIAPVRWPGLRALTPLALAVFLSLAPPSAQAQDAEALLRGGDVAAALEAAKTEATAAPDDLDRQELYIDLMLAFGLAPRAERLFRERARTDPENPDAWYLVGRAAPGADAARTAYEAALRLAPTHARSHMGMGAVHTAAGRHTDAEAAYARATRADPSLAEAWLGLVRARAASGDPAGALATADQGIAAVPGEPGLYLAVATLAPTRARSILERGAVSAAEDARIHASLAEILLAADEAPAALATASKAQALDRTLPEAVRVRMFADEVVKGRLSAIGYQAVARLSGLEPAQALPFWDELVAAHPKSALIRAGRARAHELDGNLAAAGSDLEMAIRLDPKNVEVQAALGLLRLRGGFADQAAPLLGTAWEARPWDVSLGLALATAWSGSGQADQANALLQGLAETRPFDLRVGRAYAQSLLDSGDVETAYHFVRRRLARVPDPQLGVALVAAALATGRRDEAASIVEDIARQTNHPELLQAAARLRGGG